MNVAMSAKPSPEEAENSPPASLLNRLGRTLQEWNDGWVGFWERRRSSPSARAWSEVLDYYSGLYQSKGPDPKLFRRLIHRNGAPLWRNPFPGGEAQHFLYHPDGLVLADIEAILEDLAEEWQAQQSRQGSLAKRVEGESAAIAESELRMLQGRWPSMREAVELRELETRRQQRHWSRLSAVCWGMVLLEAKDVSMLRETVHEDNLAWATVHAWKVAPWSLWAIDPSQVLDAAVRLGVLSDKARSSLIASTAVPEATSTP